MERSSVTGHLYGHDLLATEEALTTDRPSERPPFLPWAEPWRATLALIGVAALLRIGYIAFLCPYDLIEDEAHYWEWSQRLDWSYYSKGPGMAWAIAASTRVFGNTEFGVRFPAVVFVTLAALAIAALARDIFRSGRVGFCAAACFLLAPYTIVGSTLMTIDGTYIAFWALAAWFAWRAFDTGSLPAWIGFGAALGFGFLFKYTAILLVPGVIGFALFHRRRTGFTGPFAGAVAALVSMLPVVAWNGAHDWPTVRHLLGHLGLPGGDIAHSPGWTWSPLWTLEFIGLQVALVGPALLLCVVGVRRVRATPLDSAGPAYLLWCAVPTLVVYLGVTLVNDAEANWALGAYTTLMPLAALGMVHDMDRYVRAGRAWRALDPPRPRAGVTRRHPETLGQALTFTMIIVAGLLVAIGARADLLLRIPGFSAVIPDGRLMGAGLVSTHVAELVSELEESTGHEPFVVAQHYGRASLLAFYTGRRVYCASAVTGGRRSQYDYWSDTDLEDLDVLGGRPAVIVGGDHPNWEIAFDRIGPSIVLNGEHKANRFAFAGYFYRGFAHQEASP